MLAQQNIITVKNKKYRYFTCESIPGHLSIRSEDNPHKTPYLKEGSAKFNEVKAAIATKA